MFKITCFVDTSPADLYKALNGLHFQQSKEGFVWNMDGNQFRIEPFKCNATRGSSFGYRVYFDGSIDGGLYLFNLSMGFMNPKINGVEYDVYHNNRTKLEWIRDLNSRVGFKKSPTLGIYRNGSVGIVVLDDCVNLQIRPSHKKSLKVIECLKELHLVQSELQPNNYDILSLLEEDAAI